jgi:endogenous inhibitor of DNA gyrase (YacG/DUF329 family)
MQGSLFAFCSVRCKSVDLGNWLSADYRVTVAIEPDDLDRVQSEVDSPTETGAKS